MATNSEMTSRITDRASSADIRAEVATALGVAPPESLDPRPGPHRPGTRLPADDAIGRHLAQTRHRHRLRPPRRPTHPQRLDDASRRSRDTRGDHRLAGNRRSHSTFPAGADAARVLDRTVRQPCLRQRRRAPLHRIRRPRPRSRPLHHCHGRADAASPPMLRVLVLPPTARRSSDPRIPRPSPSTTSAASRPRWSRRSSTKSVHTERIAASLSRRAQSSARS